MWVPNPQLLGHQYPKPCYKYLVLSWNQSPRRCSSKTPNPKASRGAESVTCATCCVLRSSSSWTSWAAPHWRWPFARHYKMEVSMGLPPKCLVYKIYKGKSTLTCLFHGRCHIKIGWFGGTPILGNLHIDWWWFWFHEETIGTWWFWYLFPSEKSIIVIFWEQAK